MVLHARRAIRDSGDVEKSGGGFGDGGGVSAATQDPGAERRSDVETDRGASFLPLRGGDGGASSVESPSAAAVAAALQ